MDYETADIVAGKICDAIEELVAPVRDLLEVVKAQQMNVPGVVAGMEVRQALVNLTQAIEAGHREPNKGNGLRYGKQIDALAVEIEALRRRVEEIDGRLSPAVSRTMKTVAEHDTKLQRAARYVE